MIWDNPPTSCSNICFSLIIFWQKVATIAGGSIGSLVLVSCEVCIEQHWDILCSKFRFFVYFLQAFHSVEVHQQHQT